MSRDEGYSAGLAVSPAGVEAIVFDLLGCSVPARTRREAVALLPVAVSAHAAWLAAHGERVGLMGSVRVVEEVDAGTSGAADGEFCFENDLRPLADDEIDAAERVMAFSRADLLDLVGMLGDDVLDWRPPADAMARIDPWNPAPLTIREIVAGIARSESYYGTALPRAGEAAPGALDDLAVQRQFVVEALRALEPAERGRVVTRSMPWQEAGAFEQWTPRKVVRRVIGHERFHTAEILQRLSWLQLGLPVFRSEDAGG